MFSSFTKSMKSLAKGPRAVLAENIAQALAEHFVLDPEDIESSLLKDARIVLKNTSLRQRRYRTPDAPNAVISVDGVVEEVIFSWRWSLTGGGKASSSQESSSGYATGGGMVQDAMLTIKGLKVRIGLEAFDDLDEEEQQRFICESLESTSIHESKGSSAKDEASKSQKEGYVQKYMQQIVDHLTLKIEDFEFIIQPANGPSITIGGNGIELGTLASAKMPANKDEEGATTTTVLSQKLLIRSFSIHASDGKSEENYPLIEPFGYAVSVTRLSGMRFQGGILSGLEIIGLQPPEVRDVRTNVHTSIGDSQTNEGIVFHVGRLQIQALSAIGMLLAPASDPAVVSSPSSDDKDDAKKCSSSTVFNLPLPALTLVLPASEPNANATKITLSTATVVYRTDGKVFNIMGLGGIKDNGEPLISLADGGKWFVDFVNKSFVLEDASSDGGSTINVSDEAVMRISSCVAALLASDEVLKLQNAWEGQESAVAVQDQDLKSESWSISTGAMTLRLTSDTKWLEATIAHFRTVLSLGVHGYTPTEAKVGGIVIRTSSSNTTIVTAPPFSLLSDVLLVPGTIEASVESVDKALEIKDFLLSFLEMTKSEQGSPAADSSSGIQALPFAVQLECVKCSVQDRDVDVYLKDVLGVGISFKCDDVIVRAERLKVELHKSNVTFPRIPSREDQNSADSMSLGFSSDRVLISFHDTPDHANITGVVRSTSVKTNVSILGSSLQIKLMEKIYLRMEDSKGGWVDGLIDVSEVSLILDDLLHPQSLECAGANITSSSFGVMKISVPPLLLSPTNEGSTIRIGQMKNDAVDVELGSIDIIEQAQEMFTAVLGESAENKGTSDASFSVPFPIQIPRINLSVGDPFVKVNMESVAVAYDDINIESIKCKGPNDTSCTLRSINLKLGMAIAVQIGKIEDIIIPHIARFAEPIENAVIVYNDNSLSMELDSVKVQMLKNILGDNNPPNGDDGEGFEIPFPVNVNIKNFNLSSVPTEDMSLQAAGIKMKIESIDGLVNIDTNDVMSIRVVHKNEWLQCSLYPTFIALPKTLTTVIAMTCGGVSVDNCSLGLVQATLPPCTLLPENDCVVANEALVVKIESSEVLQKLQGFVSSTSSQIEKKSSEQSPASTPFPIAFTLSKMDLSIQDPPMQLIGTTISLKDFLFKCASVSCKEVSGMSASIQDVEGNLLGSNVHVKVGRLSSLVIPGVFTLHTPVEDTSIVYKGEEGVLIDVNTVRGTFERPKTRKVQDSSEEHSSVSIPFPIQFNMKSLGLKDLDSHLVIAINNIGFSVSQTGSIYSLKTREGIPMRLKRSPDEWINAKLGSISLLLVQDNGYFKPHEMQFSGGTIGPCSPSCGELSIEIPPMQKDPGSLSLSFQSNMSMTVDSVDIFEKLRPLFESIVGPQDESSTFDKFPFPVQIPGIKIFVSKTLLRIQIGSISAFESSVNIEHVHAINRVHVDSISTSMTCMKALRVNILTKRLEVSCVESLTTPVFALSKQLVKLGLSFENGVLAINIPSPIYLDMLPRGANTQQGAPRSQENDIDIPFPLKLAIAEVNVNTLISGSKSCVKMQQISCDIVPKVLPGQDLLSAEVKKGAQIAIMVRAVEHQLFQASNIRASLLIGLDDMETCNELNVSLTSVQVTAGFSSIDWTSMFDKTASENNTKEKSVKTPFANITGFSLSIAYKGIVVASGATVAVPNFGGDAFTTSHDLTSYYTNVVLKRAPGFLTNAEVLGTNVIDSTFANAGRVAMLGTSSLAGAGFGSVVGTVVADGLKGAISAGKTSRNADTADGYQFGDISRGLVRGLSQATKNGAESRGGGDGYVPGDFTVGAATAAADYTGRNKGKLASAGGAGMGSMVGMAVAGPLGFVVGSYLGGKTGKAAVEEDATSKCYLLFLFISLLQDSDNRYQYSYHPLQIKVQLSVPKMFTRKIIPIDNHIRQLIRRVPFTNSNSASSEGISLIILLVPRLDRIEFFHHHLTRLTMLLQFKPNNIILLLTIKPNNKVRLKHSITLAKPNSKLKLDPFLLNNTSKPATSSKLKPNIILVKPSNIILLLIIKPNNKVRLKHSITLAKPNIKLKLDPFLLNNTSKPATSKPTTSSKLKPNIILVKPSSNLKLKGGINLETSLKVSSQKGRRPMAGTRKMDINLVS